MEREKIEKLSDKDVVLYALYLLGGWQRRVHTEDVALKCYQLVPSRFSWVKYPQYPDLAPARFALEAAKKPKFGALVEGESEKKRTIKKTGGWRLTENGIQWIRDTRSRVEQCLGEQIPPKGRLLADRTLEELVKGTAFKKFESCGEQAEISHAEFAEALICTVNTGVEVLNERLKQIYSTAEELKREEVKKFVKFCQRKFASLLGEEGD